MTEPAKHTPGPWTIDGSYIIADPKVSHPPSYTVITFVSEATFQLLGTREANAHLIAAAPEMLEASRKLQEAAVDYAQLIQVHNFARNDVAVHRAYETLRQAVVENDTAIAKAEGRE